MLQTDDEAGQDVESCYRNLGVFLPKSFSQRSFFRHHAVCKTLILQSIKKSSPLMTVV